VCQASFGAGVAQLSAAYAADQTSLVAGSASDTTALAVGKGSTSISLAVTPKVAPRGRATYVATLQMPLGNAGPMQPGGSIDFLDGGQPISACTNEGLNSNTATCSVSYPSAGAHSITARYDGDANFTGSTSSASGVQIVPGAAKAPAVHAVLGSTLGWTIRYGPRYSSLVSLTAFAVPRGGLVTVQCSGKGCPFSKWLIRHRFGRIDLTRRFRHRHLRAGTRITVRMTRRGWIGKTYVFTIVAGHKPQVKTMCLAPGSDKPGVGCSST
jgi:Bacterial Ig-like domain (group 3)